jgi:hypothetical protein
MKCGRNGHACAWFDDQGVLSQSLMVLTRIPRTDVVLGPAKARRTAPDSVAMADRVPGRPRQLAVELRRYRVEDEHVATNPTSTPCRTTPNRCCPARRRRNVGPLGSSESRRQLQPTPATRRSRPESLHRHFEQYQPRSASTPRSGAIYSACWPSCAATSTTSRTIRW